MRSKIRLLADCPRQFESRDELLGWIRSLLEAEADIVTEFQHAANTPLWIAHNERFRLHVRSSLPADTGTLATYSSLLEQLRHLFRDPDPSSNKAGGGAVFGPKETFFNLGLQAGAWWWTTSEQQHIVATIRRADEAVALERLTAAIDVQREAQTLEDLSRDLAVLQTRVDENGDVLADLRFGDANPTGQGLLEAIRHFANTTNAGSIDADS